MVLYDSYLNINFEFDLERVKKMVDLFFLSKGIVKQNLRSFVWEFCSRGISTPIKYDEYERELNVPNPEDNFSPKSKEIIDNAKILLQEEIELRGELVDK